MKVSRKDFYTTIFSTCFSPCGNYLIAADKYGQLIIFNITQNLTIDITVDHKYPIAVHQAHTEGCIYCMIKTPDYLITGGSKEIHGFVWKELLHSKNVKPKWTLTIPSSNPFEVAETNSLVWDEENNSLIAGCGDNNVYVYDLDHGNVKQELKGHTDYIHCVRYLNNAKQILSAGEDGLVYFWDIKSSSQPVGKIEPCKYANSTRDSLGPWISCLGVDTTEDWVVCGGGPQMSIWHLRSKTPTAVLETPRSCAQIAIFEDDFILTGGSESFIYKWSMNGEQRSRFPCSPNSVFSLDVNRNQNKVLAVAGESCQIDICTSFDYKAFSLTCATGDT